MVNNDLEKQVDELLENEKLKLRRANSKGVTSDGDRESIFLAMTLEEHQKFVRRINESIHE